MIISSVQRQANGFLGICLPQSSDLSLYIGAVLFNTPEDGLTVGIMLGEAHRGFLPVLLHKNIVLPK